MSIHQLHFILKGSFDIAKNNIILCIWCNAICLRGLWFKKHIIFHILYIIVAPLYPAFMKCVDFYKAHRSEKRGVLWLASYLVRCNWLHTSSPRWKCYAPNRIVMPFPGKTRLKQSKSITNKAFVASSGDIITDYNDVYCLFARHVENKHYTTLLITRVWTVSSRNLQAVSQKCQTGGSNSTTARIKITPSFFAYTFGRCYANLPTSWCRRGGVFEWAILRGRGRVLTLVLRL